MLIRIRGYHDGIKEYLEKGQKQDREFERDEMDERVILAGDLELTNSIIQSMDTDAERYINVTLSFKEDEVSREVLGEIVREFEAFAFAAYRPDEYSFYAEAHVPRIKSYVDRRAGELVERKVHIHVVIPEVNLLTGHRLEPFGRGDRNQRFLEAFQEHINAKYGLASPKDNRRVQFTDASEMISRYKGDVFEPMNRELKASILEAVLSRDIQRYDDFRALVTEFGETRTRNAGRPGEYENVKPAGAAKGVNLKEFVFSREFIELDAQRKQAAFTQEVQPGYVNAALPRPTPEIYLDALAEWHDTRAKEMKYLNSGSRFYETWRNASPEERRRILEHREQRFYDSAGDIDERTQRQDAGYGDWRDYRRPWREPDRGPERGPTREGGSRRRWRRGADHDLDARFDRPGAAPRSAHRMRDVPGRGVDGDAAGRQMLLPADALLELGDGEADRIDALRWTGDRGGAGAGAGVGRSPAGEHESWRADDATTSGRPLLDRIAARMYERWDEGSDQVRARLAATAADKFGGAGGPFGQRQPFGLNRSFGGGQLPREFGPKQGVRSLADVQSFDAIESLPFESSAPVDQEVPVGALGHPATGQMADTVRDQFARDFAESRSVRGAGVRGEFAEIRAGLDASRLLAALAHSHGLIVEKYTIGKGADGGDRIVAGRRNLNVSDFLTKEMSLSWADAAQLLRDTWRAQHERTPEPDVRRVPEQDLWGQFQQWRAVYCDGVREAWAAQTGHEKTRRGDIRSAFYRRRSMLADRTDLTAMQRREKLASARVTRLEADAVLRELIAKERDALKATARRSITELYSVFLQERAQSRDKRALHELRRMQQIGLQRPTPADDLHSIAFSAPISGSKRTQMPDTNELLYHGPLITYEVRSGGEVDYWKDGTAFMVDEGRSLRLWDRDKEAIEIALRFAQQKFGSMLSLSGPEEFQAAVARAAADMRMSVVFERQELEQIRGIRSDEIVAGDQDKWLQQRQRGDAEERPLHDAERQTSLDTDVAQGSKHRAEGSAAEHDASNPDPGVDR